VVERHHHLPLPRLVPVTARRGHGGGPRPPKRDDPAAHAERLLSELAATLEQESDVRAGFDPRLLLKLEFRGLDPLQLEHIQGFQVVSQEGNSAVVLFASAAAMREFRRRLAVVQSGQKLTRADLLYAIEHVHYWSAEDRLGAALRVEGLPDEAEVTVDVELWPLAPPP
jgi:hypothetical protein